MTTPRLFLCAVAVLCLPLAPEAARAGFWSDAAVSTVDASGEGRVKVEATHATATVAISVREQTVDDLNNTLGQRSRSLLAFLNAHAETVRTGAVEIHPHFDYVNGTQKQNGYDGQVTARFEGDAKEIGALVSGALGNGANEVQGVETAPSDKDQEEARKTAIALAVQDALSQARAALGAANLKETKIRHLSVNVGGSGPVAMFKTRAMAASDSVSIPVQGGTQEITANVQVTLEFEKK